MLPSTPMLGRRNEAWAFGQNSYGELMLGDLQERRIPQRCSDLLVDLQELDIVQIAAGNEHTAFLCADGSVYTCGYNDSGQCGLGHTKTVVQTPTLVPMLQDKNIKHLFSFNGSEHLIALSATGECYAFGYNLRGQLGLGTVSSVPIPTRIESLVGKIVTLVSCSYHHTVMTTSDRVTYAFGRNDHGQLGLGDNSDRHHPEVIDTLRGFHVQALACGQVHTAFSISSPSSVLTCGKSDYYQLGSGVSSSQPTRRLPAAVDGILGGGIQSGNLSKNNARADGYGYEREARTVVQLAAGYYHTVAITNDGEVFAWGRNDFAQCGLGHRENVPSPVKVEALSEVSIISVRCGCYHTLFLSDDGLVFSAGRGQHGQLGVPFKEESSASSSSPGLTGSYPSLNDRGGESSPKVSRMNSLFEISEASVTEETASASTPSPSVSSGTGAAGAGAIAGATAGVVQATQSDSKHVSALHNSSELYPRIIKTLESKYVIQIAAGFYHSVCLVGPSREALSVQPSSNLSNDIARLLNNQAASDLTFIIEGKKIYAHRCIIMVRCDPLDKMLNAGMKETFQQEIVMTDQQYDIFLAFLEFLYTGRVAALSDRVEIALEFALDLLVVADQFLVNDLKALCENAVQRSINVENVAHMYKTANERQALSLQKRCFDFIMRNFAKVIGSAGFASLPPKLLQEILQAASKRNPVFTA